jgi:hypothetical protein
LNYYRQHKGGKIVAELKQIPLQNALNIAWAKVGQLIFQIDLMTHQLIALEDENKKLKAQQEATEGKTT